MSAFLLIKQATIITKANSKTQRISRFWEGFLYLSLSGHGADLELRDT